MKRFLGDIYGNSRVLLAFVVLIFPACRAVGPDYRNPEIVPPPKWHADIPEGMEATEMSDESLAQWWTALGDPILQDLVERSFQGNLDLRRATAVIHEARARRGIVDADRFPTITASGAVAFQRGSDRMGNSANAGLFSVGFDAGWEIDIFGRVRRSIEAADANLQATHELLRDTLVSLIAEVAINYVELRQYQQQLKIAEDNLRIREETLRLASALYNAGLITRLDVDQSRYSIADAQARIPVLRIRSEEAKNRLAVLLGLHPGELSGELDSSAPIPIGPVEIVVGVPAETLRRRPDVRRAERILAARTAAIGVATAAAYPDFSLSGTIGYEAITKGNPLSLGNLVGSLGASAFYRIFDADRIRQNIEVQNALQEQALIDYESAILLALEEVENALVAYSDEQIRRRALISASEAATQAVELVNTNYRAGLIEFQPVLESQRSLLSFQDQLVQSEGAVTSNLIRLYKALGGGWTPEPPRQGPALPQDNQNQQDGPIP
jgi:NodT family efflux transporter outer membrane factor (OMF) lipoprotein